MQRYLTELTYFNGQPIRLHLDLALSNIRMPRSCEAKGSPEGNRQVVI